ncbi:MAG: RusA family crossover junction endodeoxyribonuclease [Ruminococcus sp.]|nr:RusA family crossover junction endodeoxyribonuclease [Ruminococcus sp.]
MLNFFMPMIPPTATHQEKGCVIKNGRRQYYDRGNGDAEEKLKAHLAQHVPQEPFTGAVRVVCKWCYPIKGEHKNGEPYTNKPDVDNLCKALYDIMTKLGYWKDDKQIYSGITEKFWAEVPGIYIRIEEATT